MLLECLLCAVIMCRSKIDGPAKMLVMFAQIKQILSYKPAKTSMKTAMGLGRKQDGIFFLAASTPVFAET